MKYKRFCKGCEFYFITEKKHSAKCDKCREEKHKQKILSNLFSY